ncbi:MAG TPA: Gfo/Idh/MocA family oxidoreductase [Oscillospiraceae bacterium]|nr:Gfo/Idh/MocA family oxidoreductase [Oscillospiraceae bacterium]
MSSFHFGIIGAADIANKFCDAVNQVENAEVVAVSSKSLERAKAFAEKNHVPSYYDSYDEMLSRDDIDAVYIATTHNFHYDNMLSCIEHGKHILCEKSMVLTKKDAETVFARAKDKNIFVMEAMWSRFLPSIQKARQWVEEKRIGELNLASAEFAFVAGKDPKNRMYNPDLAGGAMYDLGVYDIEIMTYLINKEIRQVNSTLLFADTGVDKTDNITLKFDDCIANLQCSICTKAEEVAYLFGDKGYIKISAFSKGGTCTLYNLEGKVVEEFGKQPANGFIYEVEEVVRCVRAGKLESEVIPHKDTILCASIFDQCLRK